jgi:hypothetical protein
MAKNIDTFFFDTCLEAKTDVKERRLIKVNHSNRSFIKSEKIYVHRNTTGNSTTGLIKT